MRTSTIQTVTTGRRAALGVAAFGAAALLLGAPAQAQTTGTLHLQGTVSGVCSVAVAPFGTNNANLNLTTTPAGGRMQVGTITQNCNRNGGYTLYVQSTNCPNGTAGAKLDGAIAGNAATMHYYIEAVSTISGLTYNNVLDVGCGSGFGVAVNVISPPNQVTGESTAIYVHYTGNAALTPDTYSDTLTFTMDAP